MVKYFVANTSWLSISHIVCECSMTEDMHETQEIVESKMTRAQSTQFAMHNEILPPQPLDLRNSGEIAENWRCGKRNTLITLSS